MFENEEEKTGDYLLMDKEYTVIPVDATAQEAKEAFDDKDNYGIYISKMRSAKVTDKDLEAYFGPRSPRLKAAKERERGEPFPVRTPASIQDFIKSRVTKPNLVTPVIEGDILVFPRDKNPVRGETLSIVKTVLDNAGIKYKVKERTALAEIKRKIKELVKEEIQNQKKR
jgi:hypothetical protein